MSDREVYYWLVDKHGARVTELRAALATNATKLCIIRTRIIDQLSNRVLEGAIGQDLAVYSSLSARLKREALNPELPIGVHGGPENPLVVVVSPRILDAPIPAMELQHMQFNAAEYQLDSLKDKIGALIPTPGLHELWRGFGEFPSSYYVRKEEDMLWTAVKRQIPSLHAVPVVIMGSPGVGKSCFLMLLALYLACVEHRKVLVIRRVQGGRAAAFLNGAESVASSDTSTEVPVQRAVDVPDEYMNKIKRNRGLLVLVDGFACDEIKRSRYLQLADILATSCHYDPKDDDPSELVMLPAWRYGDLERYALSDRAWLVKTWYAKAEHVAGVKTLAAQQYALSGGNIRQFCTTPAVVMKQSNTLLRRVDKAQAFELMSTAFGAKGQRQSDRLRRYYMLDWNCVDGYTSAPSWFTSVDSAYAVQQLGRCDVPMAKHLEFYQYAASIGARFQGIAYELLLHHCVRDSIARKSSFTIELRANDPYERLELDVSADQCGGRDKYNCYKELIALETNIYWRRGYCRFPFVDAVSPCKAFPRSGGPPEHLFGVSPTQNHKVYNSRARRVLDRKLQKNANALPPKRVYVVVVPNVLTREGFELKKALETGAMVGCFEPPMLAGMEPMLDSGVSDEEVPESDEEEVTSEDERGGDEHSSSEA